MFIIQNSLITMFIKYSILSFLLILIEIFKWYFLESQQGGYHHNSMEADNELYQIQLSNSVSYTV